MPDLARRITLSETSAEGRTVVAGEAQIDELGWSVAAAGDVNGDGIADFIVSAPGANGSVSGKCYVVFGVAGGLPQNFSLSSLDGMNGIRILGSALGEKLGIAVASAGDINGDGFDDLLIGTESAFPGNWLAGSAYILFGRESWNSGTVDLASLGSNGQLISGLAPGDRLGCSVAAAGDINSDGYADVVIGAYTANYGPGRTGSAYVFFGSPTSVPASANSLDGTNGFRIDGLVSNGCFGYAVASAGDFNGDGFDDVVIGARGEGAGAVYVIFGKSGGFDPVFDLRSLDGSNGFKIVGVGEYSQFGFSVSSAGDFNDDGISDIIIGSPYYRTAGRDNGRAYVIYGRSGNYDASYSVSTMQPNEGFVISGRLNDSLGLVVGYAGDVNGDGIDDVIVGAPNANNYGTAYVLFGTHGAVSRNVTAELLTISQGLVVDGPASFSGFSYFSSSLAGLGDINSDGFGDLGFGEWRRTINGNSSGALDLVYAPSHGITFTGQGYIGGTGGADSLTGAEGTDQIWGEGGNDALFGGSGDDRLEGGAGDDVIVGGAGHDVLSGGAGADRLLGGAGSDTYFVDDVGDVVVELAGEGVDLVYSAVSFTLGNNVETLALVGSEAISGTGNGLANTLTGNGAANLLIGNAGRDTLTGGSGDDTLVGGLNDDVMTGGDGADLFVVNNQSVGLSKFGQFKDVDTITDLDFSAGDRIDISGIDANSVLPGDQSFYFVTKFSKSAGQAMIAFNSTKNRTIISLDVDGDGKADYQLLIHGNHTATTSNLYTGVGDLDGGWVL